MRANDCTKLAERPANTMSQASATLQPAPAATPLTAAMIGNGRPQLADQRIVVGFEDAAEHRCLAGLGKPIAEILAGAEAAPGAGQEERATGGVALGLGQRVPQRAQHRLVAGVEALRPIEGHDPIAVAPLDQDGHLIHRPTRKVANGA